MKISVINDFILQYGSSIDITKEQINNALDQASFDLKRLYGEECKVNIWDHKKSKELESHIFKLETYGPKTDKYK